MSEKPQAQPKDQLVDHIVCPVTYGEFLSMSPAAFKMMVVAAIGRMRTLNTNNLLRMLPKGTPLGREAQFQQNKRAFYTKLCEEEYDYTCEHDRSITDVIAGYILGKDGKCEYLQDIPFWRLFDLVSQTDEGKGAIADSIHSLMRDHYYSSEELVCYEEKIKKTVDKEACEKEEKERLAIKEMLEKAKEEKNLLFQKYGIEMDYLYGTGITLWNGQEQCRASDDLYSSLRKDAQYDVRLKEYKACVDAFTSSTGKRFTITYIIHNSLLKDFMDDATIAKQKNRDVIACIMPDHTREPVTSWTHTDITMSSEKIFRSVMDAMRAYMQKKGFKYTGL